MNELAYCGLDCSRCKFRGETKCHGCQASDGDMLWGRCELAKCCMGKGLAHCGQCDQFPCDRLQAFSMDAEYGDKGQRIENLRALLAKQRGDS